MVKYPHMIRYSPGEVYYFNAHRETDIVLMLQKRYENFDDRVVYEIFEKVFKEKIINILKDGNFGTGHVIFFVETENMKCVFRANIGLSEKEYYMGLETKFIEMYKKAGIPVGKLIYADASRSEFNFDFQIMEILEGKDLETEWKDIAENTKERYDKLSFQLGQIVARQYKAPVKSWGRFINKTELEGAKQNAFDYLVSFLDYDLEVISNAGIFSKDQVEIIRIFFLENKYIFDGMDQAYLVHHDLADHNIRYILDKIVAVFDYENTVAFDPVCELGSAPTWVCHYPRKEKMI